MKYFILFLLLFFFQCTPIAYQKTNGPVGGLFFTQTYFPGEFNQNNDVPITKRAEGCLNELLFLVMWGDAGAGSIALEYKIKRIATIDHSSLTLLGLYSRYCTIIRGD